MVGELNPEQTKQVGIIADSGRHLLALINDILDIARIEAGKMELEPTDFELQALVAETIEIIRPLADEKNLLVDVELPETSVAMCNDADKLKQVLLNLLSNAVKFTEAGGVTLSAKAEAEDRLGFTITDSGRGIPSSDIADIFEEFHRVSQANGETIQGTGLGLSICRKLVGMMGGDIDAESEPGQGTTLRFSISRNIDKKTVEGPEVVLPLQNDRGRGLVLIVEDDPPAQEMMRLHLQQSGYSVIQVFNGDKVQETVRGHRPDIITLDILMPGMDGWQVLRKLKASADTRDVPVICLSILDERGKGLALGALEYLVKPVESAVLLSEISRIHDNRPLHRVLVVDDEADARALVRQILLDGNDFEVVEAADGIEALERVRSAKPDLIISDLMMPRMDGFEFIVALRKDRAMQHIPVIICSGKEVGEQEMALLKSHASTLISKTSLTATGLLQEIVELIDEKLQ